MISNMPQLNGLVNFTSKHKNPLFAVSGNAFMILGNQLLYALLPVIFAGFFNEWKAGLIIGLFNFIQGIFLNPGAGNLSDKVGCKPIMISASISALLAGIFWIFVPLSNVYIIFIFGLLLFASYIFKNLTETYLLRTSNKQEGGVMFGIGENVNAIAFFVVTLCIPFFVKLINTPRPGLVLSLCAAVALLITLLVPNDRHEKQTTTGQTISLLNPIKTIKNGIHFIRKNKNFPLLTIAYIIFEAVFYGTIWFVFPLHLLKNGQNGLWDGLVLGIYEIVTILIAGYIGYLADKHNWKKILKIGWFVIALGVIFLPFYSWPWWLILIGIIIAFGNNLAAFSALHALEKYDIDHKEDGEFIAFKYMISDLLYALTPMLVGVLYFKFGFSISLLLPTTVGILLTILVMRFLKK